MRQALGIGYERLAGELAGGIAAWRAAGRVLTSTRLVGAHDPRRGPLVNVRRTAEYRPGHVPGVRHVELGSLSGPRIEEVPDQATIMCGHGERAMSSASLLERAGRRSAVCLGGPDAWAAATG